MESVKIKRSFRCRVSLSQGKKRDPAVAQKWGERYMKVSLEAGGENQKEGENRGPGGKRVKREGTNRTRRCLLKII